MVGKALVIVSFLALLIFGYFLYQFSPDQRFTIFFINKAVADTTVVLLGLSFLLGPLCKLFSFLGRFIYLRKYFGVFGFFGIMMHIITSVMQLYGRFPLQWYFDHLVGVIAAIIAAGIFTAMAYTSSAKAMAAMGGKRWKTLQRTGYIALVLVLVHIFYAASPRWQMWLSGEVDMPNSFVVFSVGIIVLTARLLALIVDSIKKHPDSSQTPLPQQSPPPPQNQS